MVRQWAWGVEMQGRDGLPMAASPLPLPFGSPGGLDQEARDSAAERLVFDWKQLMSPVGTSSPPEWH